MGFLDFIANGFKSKNKSPQYTTLNTPIYSRQKLTRDTYLNAFTGWVYKACTINASSIASNYKNLKLYIQKNRYEGEILTSHSLLDTLDYVNPEQTLYDYLELDEIFMGLCGESFWLVERSNYGKPIQLWHLYPPAVRPIPSKSGDDGLVSYYEYQVGGKVIHYDAGDILQRKTANPINIFRGYSPLESAELAHAIDLEQQKYNYAFFNNNAVPPFALKHPDNIDPKDWQRIKSRWKQLFKGTKNAFEIGSLEGGLDLVQLGWSTKDLDFIEGRKFTREEIYDKYGVIDIAGLTRNGNRATIEGAEYAYSKYTIQPKLDKLASFLTEKYIKLFPDNRKLYFEFDDVIPRDKAYLLEEKRASLAGQSWRTVNEVRASEGREEVAGGDDLMTSFNLIPANLSDSGKSLSGVKKKTLTIKAYETV